jgi:hypothetical protein
MDVMNPTLMVVLLTPGALAALAEPPPEVFAVDPPDVVFDVLLLLLEQPAATRAANTPIRAQALYLCLIF